MNISTWLRPTVASARILWALVTLVAVVSTYLDTLARGPVNPFNFFGYFTIQSNSLMVIVAIIAGVAGFLRAGPQPRALVALRSLTTVCMILVGVVYAILLAPLGVEGGVPVPWANWVMHVGGPILVAADWLLIRDREPLPWRFAFLQLLYPVVWTTVVLVRGATDGWVPYPFLHPRQGYSTVAVYIAIITIAFLAVSLAVVWWSQRRFWRGASAAQRST